jgi:hypothetical protein
MPKTAGLITPKTPAAIGPARWPDYAENEVA